MYAEARHLSADGEIWGKYEFEHRDENVWLSDTVYIS